MNISDNAYEQGATMSLPLKVTQLNSDCWRVTCNQVPHQQWEAKSEEAAIRAARRGLEDLFSKRELQPAAPKRDPYWALKEKS